MADNIVFNDLDVTVEIVFDDLDVTVEIYDSVIAKWVLTDYLETNPASTAYLRNRDSIQPKLSAGTNITISEDNEISADIRLDQMEQFISRDLHNELQLGTDQLLYVGFSGLLRNGGDVETRGDLPDTSEPFIAHMIKDENLIVLAYQDVALGLVWLPLSFYVDMNLYVSKEELPTEAAPIIEAHNTNEEAHPFILTVLEEIREEMANKEHFRGYYATTAEVLAIMNPETGDFAYNAQTGTKWVYASATGWSDSLVNVPDQVVEPYDGNPLMDGVASSGSVDKYSRGDHRHATDTSRAPLLHSSSATSYGVGNANLYGHLKLSDALNSTENSGDGVAATPEAVRLTNVALATETSNRTAADTQTLTDAKAYADSGLALKQDVLTAGSGITIEENTGVPVPIAVGDTLSVLFFDTAAVPDFSLFDWDNPDEDDGTTKLFHLIKDSNGNSIMLAYYAPSVDLYAIIAGDTLVYAYSSTSAPYEVDLDHFGWQVDSVELSNITVGTVSKQSIWGSYISTLEFPHVRSVVISSSGSHSMSETFSVAASEWNDLSDGSPFTKQAAITATAAIGADTLVELINDNAVAFGTYGFAIGGVTGQVITIYALSAPSASVTLKIEIGG